MKAEMDAKKEVDDAKKGASHPQPRPQSIAHSGAVGAGFVLRAPCPGAGRAGGRAGAGGAVRGGETDLWLAGRPGKHLTPGCGCVCAAAVRVCFACALCLPPERDILLKAADDEAAAMIEETKASRQREYDDVVAKSVRRRPRPLRPPTPPPQRPLPGCIQRFAEADRVSGWGRSNPATPRRPRRWRAPCSSRSPNFCPRRSRTSAHPSVTIFSKTLLLFLGLLCKRSRAAKG